MTETCEGNRGMGGLSWEDMAMCSSRDAENVGRRGGRSRGKEEDGE